MTPEEYCKDKAIKSGSSFYYSFLFLPEEKRNAITALYAFCREVDDIVDKLSNPDIARIKLGWWRSEIEKMYTSGASHPVALALTPFINKLQMKKQYFLDIIAGMEMDLNKTRYRNFHELSDYCYLAASVVGLLSISIFGYKNSKTTEYAIALGQALQLTNIIRDVGEDARRNRIYLPQDELIQFSVPESEILNGKESSRFFELMTFQTERAMNYYDKAMKLLPDTDRSSQTAGIIMANVYQGILQKIKSSGYHTLHKRTTLNVIHKFWIAWTTYRHESSGLVKR